MPSPPFRDSGRVTGRFLAAGAVVASLVAVLMVLESASPGGGRSQRAVAAKPSAPMVTGPARVAEPREIAARVPTRERVASARRFAHRRAGRVAFAVVDDRGRLVCHACRRGYRSASLSKAMLLIADLHRLRRAGLVSSDAERATLALMVQQSDNAAADVVFARNGDDGLRTVARRAGMRDFVPAGYWAEARLSARDQARLFARLSSLVPRAQLAFARRLLRTIAPWQTWGIPAASRPRWRTMYKGGWRPQGGSFLVHQAARLERRGRTISVAVLTDGNPSHDYGTRTIRGITSRLLGAPGRKP